VGFERTDGDRECFGVEPAVERDAGRRREGPRDVAPVPALGGDPFEAADRLRVPTERDEVPREAFEAAVAVERSAALPRDDRPLRIVGEIPERGAALAPCARGAFELRG